jgi:HAD superfamily hydrolase (TIGR01509 family)
MTKRMQKDKKIVSKFQRKFHWVLFDLDGTLANSLDVMVKVYQSFLARFELKGSKSEFEELNGPSLEEIVEVLRERYALKHKKPELLKIYKEELSKYYDRYVRPFPDARDVLETFERMGYEMALVTSADEKIAKPFVLKYRWNRYFKHYVCGGNVKKAKPDPAIYRFALKKINAAADTVVVIEDSPNGVSSASGAGLLVVGVTNGRPRKELLASGAVKVVPEIKNVVSVIEAL